MNKPKIYAFCNGGSPGWFNCESISEDGVFLASHICSDPGYGPHDLGVTSDWKHKTYKQYYPDGYEVIWIEDTKGDPRLNEAYKKHLAMGKEEYEKKYSVLKEPERASIVLETTEGTIKYP